MWKPAALVALSLALEGAFILNALIPDPAAMSRAVAGGGSSAVLLIRDRIQADPKDPEVANTIGTLRRFPTQQSLDTLNLIASSSPDKEIQRRATDAATEVDKRLKGILPE